MHYSESLFLCTHIHNKYGEMWYFFCCHFSQESLNCAVIVNSNLLWCPFLVEGLSIWRKEPYHAELYLLQRCLCVNVNSWFVLNAKLFDICIIEYSGEMVSTSLQSCWKFHAFTILLSWNCQQNADKILQHFGFVADFSKIVCQFMTFDNFLFGSCVSALCCLHQHMTIRYFYLFLNQTFLENNINNNSNKSNDSINGNNVNDSKLPHSNPRLYQPCVLAVLIVFVQSFRECCVKIGLECVQIYVSFISISKWLFCSNAI